MACTYAPSSFKVAVSSKIYSERAQMLILIYMITTTTIFIFQNYLSLCFSEVGSPIARSPT
jgi:hypothetical protein